MYISYILVVVPIPYVLIEYYRYLVVQSIIPPSVPVPRTIGNVCGTVSGTVK